LSAFAHCRDPHGIAGNVAAKALLPISANLPLPAPRLIHFVLTGNSALPPLAPAGEPQRRCCGSQEQSRVLSYQCGIPVRMRRPSAAREGLGLSPGIKTGWTDAAD